MYFNDMYVLNIYIVITLGDLSSMELHYSFRDYPFDFPTCKFILEVIGD